MLIVVKNRDVQIPVQCLCNLKRLGSFNILNVDGAECRGDALRNSNYFIFIICLETNRKGIHSSKYLEKDSLSLHDWQRSFGPQVSSQSSCSVGNYCNRIPF